MRFTVSYWEQIAVRNAEARQRPGPNWGLLAFGVIGTAFGVAFWSIVAVDLWRFGVLMWRGV